MTLSGAALDGGPWGLTFDSSGNLWVGGYTTSVLVEYTQSQLAATGSPTPAVTISGLGTDVVTPAFDASGNLWFSTYDSSQQAVDELTPSQLAATGSPTPAVTITTGSNNEPAGLAFDTAGDLWVGYYETKMVNEFTANQLASSGSPTPANTIAGSNTTLNLPHGLDARRGAGGDLPHTGGGHERRDRHDQRGGLPLRLERQLRLDAGDIGDLRLAL